MVWNFLRRLFLTLWHWITSSLLTWWHTPDLKELKILHKSEHFLVLNKDYDVVINSDDPAVKVSLQLQLRKFFPTLINPNLQHDFYFVHRLDYVTSGVICVALHKKACSLAASAFHARKTQKYYLALLRGHVSTELMDICYSIGENGCEIYGNHSMCTSQDPNCISPRPAHTRLLVLQRGIYAMYPATKVLLRPITGRRHQLRVHCSNIGHTIVGDYTYSSRKDVLPHRTFLHSFRLILPNSLELLDVQTSDPFPNTKDCNNWMAVETLNKLDISVFCKLGMASDLFHQK